MAQFCTGVFSLAIFAISLTTAAIGQTLHRQNPVVVLRLNGSTFEMGKLYGQILSDELRYSLNVLISFYGTHGLSYDGLLKEANQFQERYTEEWDTFLHGVAKGSGLSHDDCKILNAMETLQVPDSNEEIDAKLSSNLAFGCAFAYVPGSHTTTGHPLIARNYDYPAPFDEIAKNLIVTIFHQEGKIPTAIIGLPGQIYCPTCLSAKNFFLELNNGAPSGGGGVDQVKPSMLINMLDVMRTSDDFPDLVKSLAHSRSDYSLIVNAASVTGGSSFEYSTENSTSRYFEFGATDNFVSTNYFLDPAWLLPPPSDKGTFIGVTRRDNLLEQLNKDQPLSFSQLKDVMNVNLIHGGAKWALTIYQIVYDYNRRVISLKVPSVSEEWVDIDLSDLLFG